MSSSMKFGDAAIKVKLTLLFPFPVNYYWPGKDKEGKA